MLTNIEIVNKYKGVHLVRGMYHCKACGEWTNMDFDRYGFLCEKCVDTRLKLWMIKLEPRDE